MYIVTVTLFTHVVVTGNIIAYLALYIHFLKIFLVAAFDNSQ